MGFSYDKPLSIEEVFSKFDTDHSGTIDKNEAKDAKHIKIFNGFKVKKNMTLDAFESTNRKVYAEYEQTATDEYNKQQEKLNRWIQFLQETMEKNREDEMEILNKITNELDENKQNQKVEDIDSTPSEYTNDDDLFNIRR